MGSSLAVLPLPLLVGGVAIVALAVWLFSDEKKAERPLKENDNTSTKPPATPVPTFSEPATPQYTLSPVPSEPDGAPAGNQWVPPNSAGELATPRPPVPPTNPVSPQPTILAVKTAPGNPPLARRKFVTREDLGMIFNGGRGLTRKAAVSALLSLGFGKTAAYAALSPDGRFSAWLQSAPDGILAWKA